MGDVFAGALMSEKSKDTFMGSEGLPLAKKIKTGEPLSPELDLSHLGITGTSEVFDGSLEDLLQEDLFQEDPFFETHYEQKIALIGTCFATSGEVNLFSPLPKNNDGIKMSNDRLWYLCCLLKDLAMKQKKKIEELEQSKN